MTNNIPLCVRLWIAAFVAVTSLPLAVVRADQFDEARERVKEAVHNFMLLPASSIELWKKFYALEGFPNALKATDRDTTLAYMYSIVVVLGEISSGIRPYYGSEDGLFLGYVGADKDIHYREPGESGYDPSLDSYESELYFHTCVNETTGEQEQCLMNEEAQYISCRNNCTVLVRCTDPLSQTNCSALSAGDQKEACKTRVSWCSEYTIEKTESSKTLGYIPNNVACYNQLGRMSQIPGKVLIRSDGTGSKELGTCTFMNDKPVNNTISGPYEYCGGNGTHCEPFHGVYRTYNYDPRFRSWYMECRKEQRKRWSDPYIFFSTGTLGMTWTDPFYRSDEQGRSIFTGVLAADIELGEIQNFLVESYSDSTFFVCIYEVHGTNSLLAVSTGTAISKDVLTSDPNQTCSEEQKDSGKCKLVRSTIDDLEDSENVYDKILFDLHYEFAEAGFDIDQTAIAWEDENDSNSQAYAGEFILYEQPDANLNWRILVASELSRMSDDTIREGESLFIIICVLAGLGFAICFTLLALFYKRRFERAVVFADFRFTSLFILGCALLNLNTLTFLGPNSDELCMWRVWSFPMLTSMTISPLFIKILRTYKLLGTSTSMYSKREKMSNLQAFLLTLIIPTIQAIILISSTLAHPIKATETIVQESLSLSIQCTKGSQAFYVIELCFLGGLVADGCCLAYLTRNIDPKFGDAKALLFAMYNITFTAIMVGAIISVVDISVEGLRMLKAVGVFWASVFSSAGFVVPRLITAKSDRRRKRARMKEVRDPTLKSVSSTGESEQALKVLVCTANMGNAEPTLASMKAWIPESGACNQVTPLGEVVPFEAKTFDLIAIGMQEATWTTQRASIAESGETADEVAENRFLSSLDPNTVLVRNMLKNILGPRYVSLVEQQRGQMRLYVFALDNVAPFIEDIKCSGANTGLGNVLANKGGIVISLTYLRTRLTFLSAHLAAHEGESFFQSRCDNVYDILKGSKTFDLTNLSDTALTSHHMFVFGDLNFRTNFEGHDADDNVNRALDLIKKEDFETLYGYDELHKAVLDGSLLVDFQTLPCNFHPTFKVERKKDFVYKKQRTPSYTDRILFKSAEGLGARLESTAYEPCVDFITSDHKPIRGAFAILPNETAAPTSLEGRIRLVFKDMECSDLPAGDVEGSSDPYVMIVWDSVDIQEEASRFFRLMANHAWPQTRYKAKTLNPKWKGEKISIVVGNDDQEVGVEAMLLVTVWDYDFASADDWLGSVSLNLNELLTMKSSDKGKKEIVLDRPLQRYGKYHGRIKLKLEVSLLIG